MANKRNPFTAEHWNPKAVNQILASCGVGLAMGLARSAGTSIFRRTPMGQNLYDNNPSGIGSGVGGSTQAERADGKALPTARPHKSHQLTRDNKIEQVAEADAQSAS